MAEGGRHLAPEPNGSRQAPKSSSQAADDLDWDEIDWQEEKPRLEQQKRSASSQVGQGQAPRRQPPQEEYAWQEEEIPRQRTRQSTTRNRESIPSSRGVGDTVAEKRVRPKEQPSGEPVRQRTQSQQPSQQPRQGTRSAQRPSTQQARQSTQSTQRPSTQQARQGTRSSQRPSTQQARQSTQSMQRPSTQQPRQSTQRRSSAASQPIRQTGKPRRVSREEPPYEQQPQRRDREYESYSAPRSRNVKEERVYPDGRQQQRQRRESYDNQRPRYEDPEPWHGRGHGNRKQNLPLILLVVVLVCGVLFAGGKLMGIMLDYRRDRTAYDTLAEQALNGLAEMNVTPDPNEQDTSQEETTQSTSTVDWEYLRGVNGDVVGWLYCPNTPINYPVVQTTDNDFYLHRSFWDKQTNTSGTLFADSVCNIGPNYNNYIIYGHNMKDGSMFASIEKYVDSSYYTEHPYIYFFTPDGDYRVELIAAHITESSMTNYPYYFTDNYDYQMYLNDITSHSFFSTQASVSTEYQLMTLSTCDYSGGYNDPRFLLHGLMVPVTAATPQ